MGDGSDSALPLDGLRLVGTLILLVRTVEQQARQARRADTLALADLGVLGQIDRGADCPSQLARALHLDPASVTRLTDRLVTLGYVTRTVDLSDRRRWRLSLTAAGATRLAAGRSETLGAVDTLLDGLTDAERAGLALGVNGIRRLLDRGDL
ncbi:MAG: MarR family winged helix-turn-helix transcriptional regulator [Chloroflexota bacterium]